jgi:hypothetical protein
VGTAAGAALSIVLLNPKLFPVDLGWRLAFGLGAILGLGILLTRRFLPESPRWLMTHGREEEAEAVVRDIERDVSEITGEQLDEPGDTKVFPLEIRAMAIAFFFAVATAIGGITGPLLFGILVGTEDVNNTMIGFLIGAGWLLLAALTEAFLGVSADQTSLEEVAEPLSQEDADTPSHRDETEGAAPSRRRQRQRRLYAPPPPYAGTAPGPDRYIDREIDAIERAATEGPMSREELARAVNARIWGPGRFRRALRLAQSERRVTRVGRDTYARA